MMAVGPRLVTNHYLPGRGLPSSHLDIYQYGRKSSGDLSNTPINSTPIRYIRTLLLIRAANNAVAMSMPGQSLHLYWLPLFTLQAMGHTLEPTVISTSLTLFTLLRLPLMFLRKSTILI